MHFVKKSNINSIILRIIYDAITNINIQWNIIK